MSTSNYKHEIFIDRKRVKRGKRSRMCFTVHVDGESNPPIFVTERCDEVEYFAESLDKAIREAAAKPFN